MPNLLQAGAQWLGDVLKEHVSEPVTYHRGDASISLMMTLGRGDKWEVDDGSVVRIAHSDDDFILGDADDLCFDMGVTLPQRGDRIKRNDNGVVRVYEVLSRSNGQLSKGDQPYELDATGTILRIHTKRVGTE